MERAVQSMLHRELVSGLRKWAAAVRLEAAAATQLAGVRRAVLRMRSLHLSRALFAWASASASLSVSKERARSALTSYLELAAVHNAVPSRAGEAVRIPSDAVKRDTLGQAALEGVCKAADCESVRVRTICRLYQHMLRERF